MGDRVMADIDNPCNFAIVQATIEKMDDTTVTFTTRSTDASGDPDLNALRVFTVPLGEVYMDPIEGAPAPVPMKPGATGNLYLSRTGWDTTTPDGFAIYGRKNAVFKFPTCAAPFGALITAELRVVPTSILVRGRLDGNATLVDL